MKFSKRTGDPDRRRLDPEQAHKLTQQIIRRHAHGESIREISRATGMPRTSVHRIVQEQKRAQAEADAEQEQELQAELDDLDKGLPYDILSTEQQMQRELSEILADLATDPNDALAKYRLRHIPKDTPGHPWAATTP